MASTSETGNAKNVANFEELISFATGYGAPYNPAKPALTLVGLAAKHTAGVTALSDVNAAFAVWVTAVNTREAIFDPFSAFVTRIGNAVQASAVPPEVIADVKTIIRKLQGRRAKPKVQDDPSTPEDESASSISASQLSFDSRIENFDKLIQLLAAQAGYAPNEAELTVAGLQTLHTSMKAANLAVTNAYTALSNARIDRNKELYDAITGLVTIALEVKAYVKSLFGVSSMEYQEISAIQFTRP
ncbi:MAG: hypothetical protein IPI81_17730 [Flavobacteriales bacterium]|nr:hypothetical protein [Flavobacteriales bacterium]MCC6939494.1 hypothetical protein [Flavobacteriales bacterium]